VPSLYNGVGAYVWTTQSLLYDSDGNLNRFYRSRIRDISKRKAMEGLLEAAEEKYRAFGGEPERYVSTQSILRANPDLLSLFTQRVIVLLT